MSRRDHGAATTGCRLHRVRTTRSARSLARSSWPVACERDRHAHQPRDGNDDGDDVRDDLGGRRLQRRKRRRDARRNFVRDVRLELLELLELLLELLGAELRSQEGELVLGVLEGLRRRDGVSELLLGLLEEVHGAVRDELRLRSRGCGLVRDQREGQQPLQRPADEVQLRVLWRSGARNDHALPAGLRANRGVS